MSSAESSIGQVADLKMAENEEDRNEEMVTGNEMESDVVYENSGIFRLQTDPFGKEFEQSLNDAPALPVRNKYSRQNSRSSNASSTSKKSSYDEMSIHAGRPVIVTPTNATSNLKIDPLWEVTFDSPLKDLDLRAPSQKQLQPSQPVPVPVPAPRLSKMREHEKQEKSDAEQEDGASYVNHTAIYEELIPKAGSPLPLESNLEVRFTAPDDAPPRLDLELDSTTVVTQEADGDDDGGGGDNIYTELKPPALSLSVDGSKRCLLEEEDEPSEAISPTLSTQLNEDVNQVRAKLTTIDIRKDVNRLWDMAVQELHRDQTLIEYLEKRESVSDPVQESEDRLPSSRHEGHKKISVNSYDSVAIPDHRFKIVHGVQVPIPVKILEDFDPCFGSGEKTTGDEEESSEMECGEANNECTISRSIIAENITTTTTSDSSPDLSVTGRSNPPTVDKEHRDSTTSVSSVDIPMPAQPPPPPPLPPPKQPKTEDKGQDQLKQSPPRPYENVWIPEDEKCQIKASWAGNVTPPTPKKSPAPSKPKRLSKQISNSFKMDRSQSSVRASASSNCYEVPTQTRVLEKVDSEFIPLPREDDDDCSLKSFSKASSASTESSKDAQPQLQKKVQKSASVSNLSFITKRLSFSRFSRKVADQTTQRPTTPLSVSPVLVEEDDSTSASMGLPSSRRKSSLLSDSGWAQTRGHSGPLSVYVKGKKAGTLSSSQKWVVLGSTHLKYFNQSDSLAEPKELIPLKDILSIHQRVDAEAQEGEENAIYCFDIAFLKPGKGNKLSIRSFACQSESVRDGWVDKIAQSLSSGLTSFSLSSSSECGKLGWVYLKAMFAGEWQVSWIALKGTSFLYQPTPDAGEELMEGVDLKKTKNVTLVRDIKNLAVLEPSVPVLVVDFADRSLYLQSRSEKETLHWKTALEYVAFSNEPILSDQQLTRDGVPVVVEQCINFVFRHGCMSEGIYRHSGVKTKIDRLLAEFAGNAWSVAVTREEYSEHDVAGALKRFMRTLKDPVLTKEMRGEWLKAAGAHPDTKLTRYEGLISALPEINRLTLRRLIGHLRAISNQSERNRMPNFNLAAIWGPTLLTVDEQAAPSNFAQTSAEADVCRDLIEHYRHLFQVTDEEISREEKIMKKTENFNRNPNPIKLSGEVMMFVYFDTKTGGDCVSVAVTPKMTAQELQRKAIRKANYQGSVEGFILHEVILRGEMERPIHYKELIYDVTLKWWKWSDDDSRDTYLLLKRNNFLEEALPCAIPPLSVFGEAYFGDNLRSNKNFKKFMFSMSNAKITRSKESTPKSGSNSASSGLADIECWDIEKIIWYVGCEAKRRPPSNMNVTFIDRNCEGSAVERTREKPFFGRTISFASRELFVKWIAAMLVAEHGTDIVATDTLLNIDDD